MKRSKSDLIKQYLNRADESLDVARLCIEKQYWNTAASNLYYTAFYLIQALFAEHDIETSTHSGVKTLFSLKFIREKKLEERRGKLLLKLFDFRQEGDYGNFMRLQSDDVIPHVQEVQEFRSVILQQLRTF